jgi:putative ABC transport system permease protein
MRLSFYMPLRFLRGHYGRLALTVIALALGVALVCAIDLVNRAVLRAFVEVIDTMAGRAALQVSAGAGGLFSEEVAATVSAVPGVELAVPVVSATAFTADEAGELLTVHGVEITNEAAVRVYEARAAGGLEIKDPLLFLNTPDSVVLTRAFAARHGLRVGSQIVLETPTGRRRFTVRGLVEPQGAARVYGGNLVVMDLYAAEAAFARPGFINRVDVVVARHAQVEQVEEAIRPKLSPGLEVRPPPRRQADLQKVTRSFQVLLQGIGLIALAVAALAVSNRLNSLLRERRRFLSLLTAVGVWRSQLHLDLLKETLLVSLVAIALGALLGIGLAHLLLPFVATAVALDLQTPAPTVTLNVDVFSLALAATLGLTAAAVGSGLPVWRAVKQALRDMVRGGGAESPATRTRTWLLSSALCGAILSAIVLLSLPSPANWGLLATGGTLAGIVLLTGPLLRLLVKPLAKLLPRLGMASGHFAVAALLSARRPTSPMVGAIGVAIGALIWLSTIARSFEQSVHQALAPAMRADAVVTSAHIASGFLEAPVDERLASDIARLPGVAAVAGWRALGWPYGGGSVGLSAYDARYYTDSAFGRLLLVGRHAPDVWQRVAGGTAIVVSRSFALNLHVDFGDTVTLQTPSGPLSLPVAGVTEDFVAPRGTIELSRELFKQYWHDAQVTRIFVRAMPGGDIQSIRAAIARSFGTTYGLRILSPAELLAYFTIQVRRAFAVIPILAGLVLFVLFVGLTDAMTADVEERRQQLAAMRAIGVPPFALQRTLFVEGVLVGFAGVLLAAAVGLAVGTIWVKEVFPYLLGWTLDVYIPYSQLALAALLTGVMCVLAAVLPGRRAARIQPAEALHW